MWPYTIQSRTRDRTDAHKKRVDIAHTARRRRGAPENGTADQGRDNKVGIMKHNEITGRQYRHGEATKKPWPLASYIDPCMLNSVPAKNIDKEKNWKRRTDHVGQCSSAKAL